MMQPDDHCHASEEPMHHFYCDMTGFVMHPVVQQVAPSYQWPLYAQSMFMDVLPMHQAITSTGA